MGSEISHKLPEAANAAGRPAGHTLSNKDSCRCLWLLGEYGAKDKFRLFRLSPKLVIFLPCHHRAAMPTAQADGCCAGNKSGDPNWDP